jgi:predicted porin
MKKILSLAIAAAMVAPAAAMAEASFYGSAHMIIQNSDYATYDVWSVDSATASVGIKGSEDLGDGLKAIYQFEFEMNQDNGDGLSDNNQYIGMAGGFGTVLAGRHDTPLQMTQGSFDQFGSVPGDIKTVLPGEDAADNVIAYVSPAMGGLTLIGAAVAGEEGDTAGSGSELTGLADHTSIAGLYTNGPIFAALGYNAYDLGTADDANPSLIRGTLIYQADMFQVGGMFASMDLDGYGDDANAYGVSGNVKVGASGKIKAQYLLGDTAVKYVSITPGVSYIGGDANEVTQISVGYEHALSNRTTLHAGYTTFDVENEADDTVDVDTLFAGMSHSF